MFVHVTVKTKVESLIGGETHYVFHLDMRPGWGAVEAPEEDGKTFAIRVVKAVFDHYNVGDTILLTQED